MRIRKLILRNFKRFEKLELPLGPFNLLVGPNNSGKSTLLQACALFDYCYRTCLEKKNGQRQFVNKTVGVEEYGIIPTAHPLDLWTNRIARKGSKELVPIHLECEFSDGIHLAFEIKIIYNRFTIQSVSENPDPSTLKPFRIALIPGFTGLWPREEKRTPVVQKDMVAQGQHGGIIRNILLNLKDDPLKWQKLVELMGKIFKEIHINEPAFDEEVDKYVRVQYWEEGVQVLPKKKRPVEFDLFSAGSGFHQFLQIMAGILHEDATTILLDEPDAHLYGRLQSELYKVLLDLSREGKQIIAATHSSELISVAEVRQIILVERGSAAPLNYQREMLSTIQGLGSLENISLILIEAHRRVIVVEDRETERQMTKWLEKVTGFSERRNLIFIHAHGRPDGAKVNAMLDAIRQVFRTRADLQIKALVIADRDYAPEQAIEEELKKYRGDRFGRQTWHIWKRVEMENYLIHPEAIWRALDNLNKENEEPLFSIPKDQVLAELERLVEENRESVKRKIMDEFGKAEKGLQASTALQRAEEFLAQNWTSERRYHLCDAKEAVLPGLRSWLQENYHLALSNQEIIDAFEDNEIDPEIKAICIAINNFLKQ